MFCSTRSSALILAFVMSAIVAVAARSARSADDDWNRDNLIANGRFNEGQAGELPTGWTVVAPNPALSPRFALEGNSTGGGRLVAGGNGRAECFGYVKHAVRLQKDRTYRLRVRLRTEGLDDLHRHVVHAVFGYGFNDGIFEYRREGDSLVGEHAFPGPASDIDAEVRLCFRFSADGKVAWEQVSLQECEPIPPRPVKIAVSWGWGGKTPEANLEHWTRFLDEAGRREADLALLPEVFNVAEGSANDPVPAEPLQGAAGTFLSGKAKEWKMYVSGTFKRLEGDVAYNSAPLYDRQGKLVGVYDKNMLFDPELDYGVTPGVGYPVFQTDFGRVGCIICYDSWFPEPARLLGYQGAELVLFPNAGYYRELMPARASDNGLVIAVSSLNCPAGVWDSGGTQAGEAQAEETRFAPKNAILDYEKLDDLRMVLTTVDLSKKPSPHYWGGPMLSAPAGRRVRQTWRIPLESEIERQARRFTAE